MRGLLLVSKRYCIDGAKQNLGESKSSEIFFSPNERASLVLF